AALSLPETLSPRINVRVEGEAFEAILKFNTGTLKQYLSLDDISKRIVEATVDPKRVSNIIRETNLPKSTVYRRIERLTASRILEKKDEKVYVAEENLRKLIDIIRG
ncbi:MAG: helix-turn-helix domain-containing protein, partial [Acidilobaceae archaeon]